LEKKKFKIKYPKNHLGSTTLEKMATFGPPNSSNKLHIMGKVPSQNFPL
jgi:hypothetical protein